MCLILCLLRPLSDAAYAVYAEVVFALKSAEIRGFLALERLLAGTPLTDYKTAALPLS